MGTLEKVANHANDNHANDKHHMFYLMLPDGLGVKYAKF